MIFEIILILYTICTDIIWSASNQLYVIWVLWWFRIIIKLGVCSIRTLMISHFRQIQYMLYVGIDDIVFYHQFQYMLYVDIDDTALSSISVYTICQHWWYRIVINFSIYYMSSLMALGILSIFIVWIIGILTNLVISIQVMPINPLMLIK